MINAIKFAQQRLLHRAIKLPSTSQGKNAEINHVTDALQVNNYPSYVISNILKRKFLKPPALAIPMPEELVCMFFSAFAVSVKFDDSEEKEMFCIVCCKYPTVADKLLSLLYIGFCCDSLVSNEKSHSHH